MKNEFTLENTKEATHVYFSDYGIMYFFNKATDFKWGANLIETDVSKSSLNLTDQTGRGYPTLKWFLKCGYKLEVGDEINPGCGPSQALDADHCTLLNEPSHAYSWLYVKSTHDNRHDLAAMARDEYYSKREKQWPKNDRIDAIGQNGNNGEHYPNESESPLSPGFIDENSDQYKLLNIGDVLHNISCGADDDQQDELGAHASYLWDLSQKMGSICESNSKPVYTQEIMLNKQAGWVKAIVTHKGKRFTTFQVESGREYSRKNSKLKIRELDTRTDEEKLRDALLKAIDGQVMRRSHIVSRLIKSNKFTITLNKEG